MKVLIEVVLEDVVNIDIVQQVDTVIDQDNVLISQEEFHLAVIDYKEIVMKVLMEKEMLFVIIMMIAQELESVSIKDVEIYYLLVQIMVLLEIIAMKEEMLEVVEDVKLVSNVI